MNFSALLHPRSIAVVGASHDRKKIGNVLFRNCLGFGYRGKVYPVNPTAKRIEGKRAYASIGSLPVRPDLVIIATPAVTVPAVLRDAVRARAKAVIVISAGFAETGMVGTKLERQIMAIAKKGKLALLGPNCLGMVLPHLKLNASFSQGMPDVGNVTILSQSGAIAVANMEWAKKHHVGFRAVVSLGNKAVLGEEALLEVFGKDKGTGVILMYLEDIRSGRAFLETAQQVSKQKPVIILRAGKTAAGAKAAFSHTGALAGSGEVTDALLRQAGCTVVRTTDEWFALAAAFEQLKRAKGNRLAILTNAGGAGILATDAMAGTALQFASFKPKTIQALRKVLPPAASVHNPVDVIGDAPPKRYADALRVVVADPGVDIVVACITHQMVTQSRLVAKAIVEIQKRTPKPIIPVFIGGAQVQRALDTVRKANLSGFAYPETGIFAAGALARMSKVKLPIRPVTKLQPQSAGKLTSLVGAQAAKLLRSAKISVLPTYAIQSAQQAVKVAKRLAYPVVMKLEASSVLHKTEAGAVTVDLHTPAMVQAAYTTFARRFRKELKNPNAHIVLQDQRQGGVELILGAVRDPQFGPIIVLGFGGIFVEAMHSVAYACAPMTLADVKIFVESSPVWKVLRGARGQEFATREVMHLVAKLSSFIAKHPKVQSVDLNPVLVNHRAATPVDARIMQFPV
ncbi:MAG: acetate--CoA ligase family protein [Patescibacteria group bacterium]